MLALRRVVVRAEMLVDLLHCDLTEAAIPTTVRLQVEALAEEVFWLHLAESLIQPTPRGGALLALGER